MSELRENLRRLIVLHITSSGYTVDELTDAAIALVRDAALEEAAKVADVEANQYWDNGHPFRDGTALHIAAVIRALKDKP